MEDIIIQEVIGKLSDFINLTDKQIKQIEKYISTMKLPEDFDISKSDIEGTLDYYFIELILDRVVTIFQLSPEDNDE